MAFGLPTRASYTLTASSPSSIDDITPRHTLNVQDLDGEGKEWTVTKSCAKVVIFNSKNLTLRLRSLPLTSTVELFGSSDVTLILDAEPSSPALGILQLDPTISNVRIHYATPSLVGSIVLAPNRTQDKDGKWTFGFSSLTLRAAEESFELVDAQGRIHEPGTEGAVIAPDSEEAKGMPQQWVVKRSAGGDGWAAEPLKRSGATEYPLL